LGWDRGWKERLAVTHLNSIKEKSRMKRIICIVSLLVLGLSMTNGMTLMAQQASASETQEKQLKAYADALRSDVKTEKKAILTRAMQFTPEEDKAFWPLYNDYLAELTKLGDERISIIRLYADNYQKMTNAIASDLAKRSIAVQKSRTMLLEKYYQQVAKVMTPIRAARFLQIENTLNMLIDIQLASEIPLME
jgi:hypothetical protein